MSNEKETLLPCPFCGSESIDAEGWMSGAHKTGPACDDCSACAETVELWNSRPNVAMPTFQERVNPWLLACFGEAIARDPVERNHRFLEESLELAQACGCTASEAHQLVDYVFGRPVGEKKQETGGVMVTLAALCLARGLDMHAAGETELARVWTKVDQIRAKQAAKPKHSPLPEASALRSVAGFLCFAYGESDIPCARLVETLEEVGTFFCDEWFGEGPETMHEEARAQYDHALERVLVQCGAEDRDGEWSTTFEIGGIWVRRVAFWKESGNG